MLQYELSQVLYPVFLHCCLKLVANEAGSEATQLIGRYSQRFTTIGGQPSKVRMQVHFKTAALCCFLKSVWLKIGRSTRMLRMQLVNYSREGLLKHTMHCSCGALWLQKQQSRPHICMSNGIREASWWLQELNELQAVSIPEHLTTNRIAQAVQRTRYPVVLCTYSHELLMHFLQGQRLFLVLGIINDHIKFEVGRLHGVRCAADLSPCIVTYPNSQRRNCSGCRI